MLVRNQRGSILVVVLVVVFCLSIIGVSLAGLSLNDQRQTVRQQRTLKHCTLLVVVLRQSQHTF
jgi:Tfp pilus assembly protein PilX